MNESFKKQKETGTWEKIGFGALGIVVVTIIIFIIMLSTRWFSNATTPITVHEVEPGIKCATMVTSDGAAISCWQVR